MGEPTGTVAGDLLVVGLAFEKGSDVTITPPAGWTLIRRTNQSSNVGYASYRKTAGASEPSSYGFSLTNSSKWSIGGCAITGADTAAPIDVHNGASAASGNPSAPSITTSGQNRLVLAFYANKKPATYSNYTSPAVERFDAPNTSAHSNATATTSCCAATCTAPTSHPCTLPPAASTTTPTPSAPLPTSPTPAASWRKTSLHGVRQRALHRERRLGDRVGAVTVALRGHRRE